MTPSGPVLLAGATGLVGGRGMLRDQRMNIVSRKSAAVGDTPSR